MDVNFSLQNSSALAQENHGQGISTPHPKAKEQDRRWHQGRALCKNSVFLCECEVWKLGDPWRGLGCKDFEQVRQVPEAAHRCGNAFLKEHSTSLKMHSWGHERGKGWKPG